MAPPVARQEIDAPSAEFAAHDNVRWRAERRLDFVFSRSVYAFHLEKAAPADHADRWYSVVHFLVVAQAFRLAPPLSVNLTRLISFARLRIRAGVVRRSLMNAARSHRTDRELRKELKESPSPWRLCRVALTSACSLRNGGGDPFVYRSRASMPKFFIKTYGCQMNERDSEQVARSLIDRGYAPAASEAEADIVLLNTCSVRDMAEQKALGKMGMLGRLAKERPGMVFGFLGCMAQARGAELLRATPHLDLVVGTQKFHRVAEYVEELVARKRAIDDPRFSIVDTANEAGSQETIRDHTLRPQQAAAFVSIMQGCNMHCTFCIVPRTRGVERSRSIAAIVREVRALVDRGVKEVTLLG